MRADSVAAQAVAAEAKLDDVRQLGLCDEDVAAWKAQDAALSRLPEAMVSAFSRTEHDFYTHSKVRLLMDQWTLSSSLCANC